MGLHEVGQILVVVLLPTLAAGSGTLSFKLAHYFNGEGRALSGQCCDGIQPATRCNPNICDPYFVVTIYENGPTPVINKTYTTGSTPNTANITFLYVPVIGTAPNPVIINYRHWVGSVVVNIDVFDDNTDQQGVPDYLLATLTMNINQNPLPSYNHSLLPIAFPHVNNNSLEAQVNIRCDTDYYGIYCTKHCHPADNATGHYTCNENGDRVCRRGWGGDPKQGCLVRTATCVAGDCKNGGTCIKAQQSTMCSCAAGYTGLYCESVSRTARAAVSGVTTTGITTMRDFCGIPPGPCQNGGSCTNTGSGFHCSCATGFSGENCGDGTAPPAPAGGGVPTVPASAAGPSGSPQTSNNTGNNNGNSDSDDGGVNVGGVAGGAVAGLLLLGLAGLLLFLLYRRRNRERKVEPEEEGEEAEEGKVTTGENGQEKTTPDKKS